VYIIRPKNNSAFHFKPVKPKKCSFSLTRFCYSSIQFCTHNLDANLFKISHEKRYRKIQKFCRGDTVVEGEWRRYHNGNQCVALSAIRYKKITTNTKRLTHFSMNTHKVHTHSLGLPLRAPPPGV